MIYDSIGFLEFNSIAKGIEAADAVLKAAEVELIYASTVCPGKYTVLFKGEVAAVQASLDVGAAVDSHHLIDKCIIPRVHSQVMMAINQGVHITDVNAIGVMEFFSITASIFAADAAAKAADVSLIDVRLGMGIGGKSFVILSGDVAAANEAVMAGIRTKNAESMLVSWIVIPNPRKEVFNALL